MIPAPPLDQKLELVIVNRQGVPACPAPFKTNARDVSIHRPQTVVVLQPLVFALPIRPVLTSARRALLCLVHLADSRDNGWSDLPIGCENIADMVLSKACSKEVCFNLI